MGGSISWPDGEDPDGAHVFTHNARVIRADQEDLWEWLVAAATWPDWYRNARRVTLPDGNARLSLGLEFRWTTFGTRITSVVTHCDRPDRIGWTWWTRGARGHHGWVLTPVRPGGVLVVTEETQRGPLPRLLRPMMRPALSLAHEHWLRRLAVQAGGGPP